MISQNDVLHNRNWEIQIGVLQTGSTFISACRQDRNEIPLVICVLARISYAMELSRMFYNRTGSGKSKMASFKSGGQACGQDMNDIPRIISICILFYIVSIYYIIYIKYYSFWIALIFLMQKSPEGGLTGQLSRVSSNKILWKYVSGEHFFYLICPTSESNHENHGCSWTFKFT